jgi:hypothetical protein
MNLAFGRQRFLLGSLLMLNEVPFTYCSVKPEIYEREQRLDERFVSADGMVCLYVSIHPRDVYAHEEWVLCYEVKD